MSENEKIFIEEINECKRQIACAKSPTRRYQLNRHLYKLKKELYKYKQLRYNNI